MSPLQSKKYFVEFKMVVIFKGGTMTNGTILPKQYFKKHIAKIMALLEITGNEKLKEEIKSEIWDIRTETERDFFNNGATNGKKIY